MQLDCVNNLNNHYELCQNPNFTAQAKPVNQPEKMPSEAEEKADKKKRRKVAVAVSGSVLGLSLAVTLLNPRVSTKLIEKLKVLKTKTNQGLERSKNNVVQTKFYKALSNGVDWSARFLSWTNNINSVKDTYYKRLCTEEKMFSGIKNPKRRERFIKIDKIFRKIMQKPHETITKWGDSLAKLTVRHSYKRAAAKMDKLDNFIIESAKKLPEGKQQEVLKKLSEIGELRKYFSATELNKRLVEQEKLMQNLNNDIRSRWKSYYSGFIDKEINSAHHFDQNLQFWAKDIIQPQKTKLEKEGLKFVEDLTGKSGRYSEIISELSGNLNEKEQKTLNKLLNKTKRNVNKAHRCEYDDYFDKKRDLTLGSAPTDILTGSIILGIAGISYANADNKDKRISRLITKIIPAVAGFGTSIALTSMLFSGTKGMLSGLVAGGVLSLIGSKIDKHRLNGKNNLSEINKA